MRQNGQYYGLFTFVEDTDDQYLMVCTYQDAFAALTRCVCIHERLPTGFFSKSVPLLPRVS